MLAFMAVEVQPQGVRFQFYYTKADVYDTGSHLKMCSTQARRRIAICKAQGVSSIVDVLCETPGARSNSALRHTHLA